MQQHPVPQNIIDVEFKLFGSFTLKQFGKILFGCLGGLIIYFIPLPDLLKFPLIFISILLGIGMAIIPNLGVWLNGFTKAIFLSPRYVWVKQTVTPEILQNTIKKSEAKDTKVESAIAKEKIDITTLPLDKLFGTKSSTKTSGEEDKTLEGSESRGENFVRVYEDVFGDDIFQRDSNSPLNQVFNNQQNKSQLQQTSVKSPMRFKTIEEYNQAIQKLKFQLSMLAKDTNYKEKEEEIMSQINELYQQIKAFNSIHNSKNLQDNARFMKNLKEAKKFDSYEGRVVFGIVVDKKENPIPAVNISFTNNEQKTIYKVITSKDGKFTTVKGLPFGNYSINLDDKKHKFHTYSIDIKDQLLPAYKFREK